LIADFDSIRISLASPEKIRSWSHGEVTKPETINYRTFKPERDGLFCARIFGPTQDWECLCGKYKRMKHRGVICDKCGVEVTLARVRRERLGHIELASPCSHVWFFKGLPSRIGHLLDITLRELERVLYFEAFVVVDPGEVTGLSRGEVITDERKRQLDQEFPGKFVAMMGAEGIKELLKKVDVEALSEEIRERMKTETSQQKKLKYAKRLRVVESFRKSGNKPEWMILDVIPVIPPELRPLVPLDGGRFATSDLNDLYRRVINRNNRLKKLIELHAPDVIVRNEKRMLQEAVDALFDNGRRGRVLRGANNRPLKSLSDTLKGKQGRFRQNLLGKRVDYSGRSVIVVGPDLRLNQCGLPKKMALELFKPFIYHRLEQRGHCTTIKQAKELVEQQDPVVWDILEEVIKDHPILLNRAPTLHRLGIQAFEPVLVEGKAIKIHPLVCTAFNADFDGDQMAVHIPLSPEAQIEAATLMLSANNILSPAHGGPIAIPTQDMVLGCYYLTKARPGTKGEGRTFASTDDVLIALEMGEVETLTPIKLRYTGRVIDLVHAFDSQNVLHTEPIEFIKQYMETTVGRVILNDHLPQDMPFINGLLKKKGLGQLVQYCYLKFGLQTTVGMLDEVKNLGFLYATRAGISIGIDDMVVPGEKPSLVREAEKEVVNVENQYQDGAITHGERYNKIIEIWSKVTERVSDEMFQAMEEDDRTGRYLNPIYIMADSGARGSKQQIRQLSGMRGLMAKPSGEIIETPITANFREGLDVLQYFISTHGARKGLADTALKTADSGYLTRRLVDVAQDVIVTENDCGTTEGIYVEPIIESGEIIEPLRDRIVGRVALEDQKDYEGNVIVAVNQEITEDLAAAIQSAGIERVKIRSVLTCESKRGVCVACYGRNLATGRLVERGEAVGVIAAQSIGEPGTQLTMRTFHIGGTATRVSEQSTQDAKSDGFARYIGIQTVRSKAGELIAMNRNGIMAVVDDKGREKERYPVVYGARVLAEDGAPVKNNQILLEWDPYTFSILTEVGGAVHFRDLVDGLTLQEQVDEVTGMSQLVVTDSPDEKRQPTIEVRPETTGRSDRKKYLMPTHAHLMVRDGEEVHAGDVLAKIPRETTKTKDITGGLPRVVELFEARKPRETAIIAEINGQVKYGEVTKGQRKIYVEGEDGEKREYSLPRGVHINVQEGERVKAGEPLMDGPRNPHDILDVLGEKELQKYLVNEIQEVYRLQGVNINDKHLEVISRQMMRWVKIEDIGDTEFLPEEIVDKFKFRTENQRVMEASGRPAQGKAQLLGITKASLSTDSFISAASFQETTRVLTEAAINGKVDYLRGLKENVIMGRLVPAGTGMEYYRRVKIAGEDVVEEAAAEPALEAIPGYDEEARIQYAGGLPEDTGEESLAE
jgi:DNA-directed RNA polymerase subunit beta'